MELQVDTNDLALRIAEALREHEEKLLSELAARVARELEKTPDPSGEFGLSDDPEIMGIEPHALYPVSFLAERWDVSEDNVRKKSQGELPRTGWKGGEIRYRGIDILRYEGVDVEDHIEESLPRLEDKRAEQPPTSTRSNGQPSSPDEETENGRPYQSNLPELSDGSASTD